jgi:hypothetical protein
MNVSHFSACNTDFEEIEALPSERSKKRAASCQRMPAVSKCWVALSRKERETQTSFTLGIKLHRGGRCAHPKMTLWLPLLPSDRLHVLPMLFCHPPRHIKVQPRTSAIPGSHYLDNHLLVVSGNLIRRQRTTSIEPPERSPRTRVEPRNAGEARSRIGENIMVRCQATLNIAMAVIGVLRVLLRKCRTSRRY